MPETTDPRPSISERDRLLRGVLNDARQAVDCMMQGDWLRADVLMKLAIDQLAETGLIP